MKSSMVSIETTIKGGLPVIVDGIIALPEGTRGSGNSVVDGPDWPGHPYVEELRVRFRSGHAFPFDRLNMDDEMRVVGELMEAWRER